MDTKTAPDPETQDRDWPFVWMGMAPPLPQKRSGAPLPANEAQRIQALTRTEILDSLPEQAYDDLVALASQICGTPIAMVSLVDRDRQWFKAKIGLQTSETHRDLAFCAHALLAPDDVFAIHDAQRDARFAGNPMVTGAPHIRFYAGAPIVTAHGEALGTVCVIDTKPRELTDAQKRCLRVLARQASTLLEIRHEIVAATKRERRQEVMADEARLAQERGSELLDLVLRGGDLGMWDLHVPSGQWTVNAREWEMLGLDAASATPARMDWRDLVHPDDRPGMKYALEQHLATGSPNYTCTLRMRHRSGHWVWLHSRAVVVRTDAAGRPVRIVGTHQDITETREARLTLDGLSRTDTLTGLANRQHFDERMTDVMARALRSKLPCALLILDVDQFRGINAQVGHAGGDEVLRQFATRLRSCVRQIDLLARYAADQFLVVLEGIAGDDQARVVATEIVTGMQLPFRVKDCDLVVSTSIGLTHFSGIAESIDAVIARAEVALAMAKASGPAGICTN